MEFIDYYKTLEIKPDADIKVIKTAYRRLARKYHPDVSEHQEAEKKFKEVAEAYEVLKDKEKRLEFDQIRQYSQQGQKFDPNQFSSQHSSNFDDSGFSDFFSSIFGQRAQAEHKPFQKAHSAQKRGQDLEMELPIFLEETLKKNTKTISYDLPIINPDGRVSNKKKTLNVNLKAGLFDGERVRLKGQGASGIGDSSAGDLFLRIRIVPHPLFDIEGPNLFITIPLAPWEAALGTKINVPTLSGKIQLSIPANSQAGSKLRIKGKGLVQKGTSGDLYAILQIVMPADTNDAAKEQWKALAKTNTFNPRTAWKEDVK